MITCLLLWGGIAACAWLVGAAVLRAGEAGGFSGSRPESPVVILFGLCCLTVLAGFWSLFARIGTGAVAAGLLVVAACAVVALRTPRQVPILGAAGWLLLGLAVVIAAAQAAGPFSSYDTGLYHLQAIRWIQGYPAVPGLANLHDRLALGAPWFVAQALFDPELLGGRYSFSLNGLVFAGSVACFLGGLAGGREHLPFSRLLRLGCVPLAFWLLRRYLSSSGPEVMLALTSWVVLLLLAEKLESGSGARLDSTAFVITGLAVFAAVTKLSAAPLLLAPAWLIGRGLWTDRHRAVALTGFAFVVAAPFLIRNVILSGYLLIPVPWTRVPGLAWAVPRERMDSLLARIGNWARVANGPAVPALDLAAWLPAWIGRLTWVERVLLAVPPLLALGYAGWMLWRRRTPDWPPGFGLLAALTLAGTLFWLCTAPDPRFGWGFFPFLALLLAAVPVSRVMDRLPRMAVALVLAILLLDQGLRVISRQGAELADAWLWPVPPPAVETRPVAIGSISVAVPVQGEQCWDMPIPCAPVLDPALTLRGPGLRSGFLIRLLP